MSSEKLLSDMPHESLSEIQKELQNLLKSHLTESYPSEESAGSVFCKNGNINVTITGEKTNLRNFWSGRISSTWVLTPAPPPNSALTGPESSGDVSDENDVLQFCISGDIKTHAHYYEDGNVQLQSSRSFPSKQVNLDKKLNTIAKYAMTHIKESEKSLQAGLQNMYLHMNEETFRQMRRLMPVTR
jgi:capping protein alpha